MRDILRKSKPQRLDDLIALNALYRPGPLRSGMVDDYIARKQGKTEIKYELPELEPILADTYGVIAYQEQVMRISNVVAGFTLGEADLLRKAMGKKNAEVMAKMRGKFVEGAKKLGTDEKKAAPSFDLMEHFAGYGFNKSHSTAYAFLAYQTAYLKANYPWHFAAALLTIEAQNTDKLALYLGECRDRGIPVLPPDINESQLRFTVDAGKGVRFGLTAIKNVGEGAIESLLERPHEAGPHHARSHALCEDLDLRLVNKRVFESLTKAGAFDSLADGHGATRRCRRWRCGRGCSPRSTRRASTARACSAIATRVRRSCSAASTTTSDGRRRGATRRRCRRRRRGPRPSSSASRRRRSASTGAAIRSIATPTALKAVRRARPIAELAEAQPVAGAAATRGDRAAASRSSPTRAIGGIVAACRQLKTRKGDRMAVFTLEDAHRRRRSRRVSRSLSSARAALIETGTLVLVRGKLERDDETVADPGVRDRAARQRARAAGARGGDPSAGCRPTAACSKRSAKSSRAIAAIAACRSRSNTGAAAAAGCACGRRQRRRSACGRRRR